MTITEYWVTTSDNPFNPFTEWENWYRFDEGKGYHTTAYVARIPDVWGTPSDAPPLILQEALKVAVDQICQFNLTNVEGVDYIKVTREIDTDVEDTYVE